MIWVDAHLSPALARWIDEELGHPARALRDLGLTCGNTSNAALRVVLRETLPKALELFGKGEPLVEIGGRA